MTAPRVAVVASRVLRQIRHDRRTLALIVLQPLLVMTVFGYAFGGDITGARVAVANLDRGTLGQKVIERVDRGTVVVVPVGSGAEAEAALREGRVAMGVVIPANYSRNAAGIASGGKPALIDVYEDKTNPQVTSAALAKFGDAVREALENETGRPAAAGFEERVVFGEDGSSSLSFLLPGIAAFGIFQLGSLLTVVGIVKERTQGTLQRMMASPVLRGEVVFGYAAAFGLLSLVQAGAILAVAVLVFRVHLHGSVLLALLGTALVGLVALGFGILVSGLARSEFQAVQAVFLVTFPNLFLAGVFSPLEAMPAFLRPFSRLVPLTYAVRALRSAMNHGAGLAAVAPDLLVLAAFALAFLGIATFSFGRRS